MHAICSVRLILLWPEWLGRERRVSLLKVPGAYIVLHHVLKVLYGYILYLSPLPCEIRISWKLGIMLGNGNPLQYSCLGNPMGGEAWQTTVHGITELATTEQLHFFFFLTLYSFLSWKWQKWLQYMLDIQRMFVNLKWTQRQHKHVNIFMPFFTLIVCDHTTFYVNSVSLKFHTHRSKI